MNRNLLTFALAALFVLAFLIFFLAPYSPLMYIFWVLLALPVIFFGWKYTLAFTFSIVGAFCCLIYFGMHEWYLPVVLFLGYIIPSLAMMWTHTIVSMFKRDK